MSGDFTSYTQKPEEEQLYCTSDVGRIAGCSNPTVHRLAKQLKIQARIYANKNSRAAYFSYEEMKVICEAFNKHGNDYKNVKEVKTLALEESAEDHPLVTNKEFLKLNVWPDVTPACFQELGE